MAVRLTEWGDGGGPAFFNYISRLRDPQLSVDSSQHTGRPVSVLRPPSLARDIVIHSRYGWPCANVSRDYRLVFLRLKPKKYPFFFFKTNTTKYNFTFFFAPHFVLAHVPTANRVSAGADSPTIIDCVSSQRR